MSIARERREILDFAYKNCRDAALSESSKKPSLPTGHGLLVVNFYHPNATFKMSLLQKKCYKCSRQILALQVRKNLRSSFAMFNFPLCVSSEGFRAGLVFLIFSPPPLNRIGQLFVIQRTVFIIFLSVDFMGKMKTFLCPSPLAFPRTSPPSAPRDMALLSITAYSTLFQAGD